MGSHYGNVSGTAGVAAECLGVCLIWDVTVRIFLGEIGQSNLTGLSVWNVEALLFPVVRD